jgi:S1-C subfamily serine protease
MRRALLLPLLIALGHGILPAQEPRPPREPIGPVPTGRDLPPELVMPRGAVRVLTTRRARLGIFVSARPRETDSIGALVERVTPNGPAARAGLRSGDFITRFNGTALVGDGMRVSQEQSAPGMALTLMAAGLKPGDTVAIEYRRGKQLKNASVVAGDEPTYTAWATPDGGMGYVVGDSLGDFTLRFQSDSLGMRVDTLRFKERRRMSAPMFHMMGTPLEDLELAPLNRDLGRYFGSSEGILVINVPEESKLGLKAGDVVMTVDGRTPLSPPHLLRILRSYEAGEPIRFEIMRMKKRETVTGSLSEG